MILALSFALSLFFALGGVGSAIALVPILQMLGVDYQSAKAIGLIVTISAMLSATISNVKTKSIDYTIAISLLISSSLFSVVGVYISRYIEVESIKILFVLILIFSASVMLFFNKKSILNSTSKVWLYLVGSFAGTVSGLLGIGGGLIIMPFLIMLGFNAKKVALSIGLVITVSASTALAAQMSILSIEPMQVMSISIAGVFGGLIGNYLLRNFLREKHIKKVLALFLYILAVKISLSILT